MPYSIRIKKSAYKELQKVPKSLQPRIAAAIDGLAVQPYTGKVLKGDLSGLRRLRVGDYRIIYEINNEEILILILRIAHRKKAYQ